MKQPRPAITILCMLIAIFSLNANAVINASVIEQGVVRVISEKKGRTSTGSGSILNKNGYIVTNQHVIAGANKLLVSNTKTLPPQTATIIWQSRELDLAILQSGSIKGSPVTLSSTQAAKGSSIFALGYPGAADDVVGKRAADVTMTRGIIGRVFTGPWGNTRERSTQAHIIQHDAAINPGNSGGPLFDACGHMAGINTGSHQSAQGIFLALNVSELIRVLKQLGIAYRASNKQCTSAEPGSVAANQLISQLEKELQESRQTLGSISQTAWLWRSGMVIGICTAFLLALRKPRERIVHIVEQAVEPLTRRVQGYSRNLQSLQDRHLHLNGTDANGNVIAILINSRQLANHRKSITLGRHRELNDHVIQGQDISRRHLRIGYGPSGFTAEDLNSSNGSKLNGQNLGPFQAVAINDGDRIILGTVELILSIS